MWQSTSVALTAVAAHPPATALRVPVMTLRIPWKTIAGTTPGMQMDSGGLAGRRRSVVAIPDLPHRPDDVVTVVTVSITAEDILHRLEAKEPLLLAPRVDTAVNVLVGMARVRSS